MHGEDDAGAPSAAMNDILLDDVMILPVTSSALAGEPSFTMSNETAETLAPQRNWYLHPQRNGGARRDRTDDLKLAKLALSQLSYGPNPVLTRSGAGRW